MPNVPLRRPADAHPFHGSTTFTTPPHHDPGLPPRRVTLPGAEKLRSPHGRRWRVHPSTSRAPVRTSCVRCPLLRPGPAPMPRRQETRDSLSARVTEGHREGWLGEVSGLEAILAAADLKLQVMQRIAPPRCHSPWDV